MSFARKLIDWQRRHGRHDLPWQGTRDPYRLWVAEIMLQQTRVEAVIPYYRRFMARFPDLQALAAAPQDEVLRLWSGLGYYARARNLHLASQKVVFDLKGVFPKSAEQIKTLPGVGRSTAAAIAAFAFGERAAILDGNVKRVLSRCFARSGDLWPLAERLLPGKGIEIYTQALMDLGATLCTRANPACVRCPVARRCVARREGRVGELPAPRKRKDQPTRRARWLVLLHGNEVLLERRPGAGIWGGLWAFPEPSAGCEINKQERLPAFEHGFTHFRLRVQPFLCRVKKLPSRLEAPGRIWLPIEEAMRAAVPAPVKKLLAQLAGE